MKKSLLFVVLLICGISVSRALPTAQGVFNQPVVTPEQQRQMAIANQQYQRQQVVIAAQKAAAQAAEYAKQAAPFNNAAAKLAAEYAGQAAVNARRAAIDVQSFYSTQYAEYAADAEQAAVNAKQAAGQAEIDSAVTKLENERDEAIAELKTKYAPNIADYESQLTTLKQKAGQLDGQMSQSEREGAHLRAKQLFQPKDPWRLLDGKICNAKDVSWEHFTGQILEVKPNGILVHGDFGPPLAQVSGSEIILWKIFRTKPIRWPTKKLSHRR